MNDEPLNAEHGAPVRAVVPGWFGMASVKWLQRIVVTTEAFQGYYQSIDYAYWENQAGLPGLRPLREMQVKAQIARPTPGEAIATNSSYRVFGAAWASENEVATVELSVDGARSWSSARLLGESIENAWRFWEFNWQTPAKPGAVRLIARATDSSGRTQPKERIPEYGSYMINHLLPVEVQVR